jgi:hypothetical protein
VLVDLSSPSRQLITEKSFKGMLKSLFLAQTIF